MIIFSIWRCWCNLMSMINGGWCKKFLYEYCGWFMKVLYYVIFEILLYYTWIHYFLILNVNLSSSGCLVYRLAIVRWCRHAGPDAWNGVSTEELPDASSFSLLLESRLGLWLGPFGIYYVYVLCWSFGSLVVLFIVSKIWIIILSCWYNFWRCYLFRSVTWWKFLYACFGV